MATPLPSVEAYCAEAQRRSASQRIISYAEPSVRLRSFLLRWKRFLIAFALRQAIRSMQPQKPDLSLRILQYLSKAVPTELVVRICLARLALTIGDEAIAADAVRLDFEYVSNSSGPRFGAHARRIAAVYIRLHNLAEALRYLQLAKAYLPTSASVSKAIGDLYFSIPDVDSALRYYNEQATFAATTQQQVEALNQGARVLDDAGRSEMAIEAYQRVLAVVPHNGVAHSGIASIKRITDPTDLIAVQMRHFLRSSSVPAHDKMHLHFALGSIYDHNCDAGMAFAHFSAAHQLRSRTLTYVMSHDSPATKTDVDSRRDVFTAQMIADHSRHGCLDDFLICVVGMPRSGTTLVERILGAHPKVAAIGEREDFLGLRKVLPRKLKSRTTYPECCKLLTPSVIRDVAGSIRDRFSTASGSSSKVVTKMPFDCFELGLISILFPKARIIHCRRNILDTCLSCHMQDFNGLMFSSDLQRLADVYEQYKRMMAHWREVLPESLIFEIDYEKLVDNTEPMIRALCDFCGIHFDQSCLSFFDRAGIVQTASNWQVRRPIYRDSVKRSERYREFLGPLLGLEAAIVDTTVSKSTESHHVHQCQSRSTHDNSVQVS